jgi:hypothetical protein
MAGEERGVASCSTTIRSDQNFKDVVIREFKSVISPGAVLTLRAVRILRASGN